MYQVQKYKVRLLKDGVLRLAEPRASCYDDAKQIFFRLMANLGHEEMHVIMVDNAGNITGVSMVAIGGTSSCAITQKDVFRAAVACNASAIVLGHNHPSGDPKPSHDDIETTKTIARCGELLGVRLLDHLVVCPEKQIATSIPSYYE
jgi:DNA repair protein RadC